MKNKTQYIAVFAGIALVAFLLYGNSFMSLFNTQPAESTEGPELVLPETGVETEDEVIGTGLEAKVGDTVTVHYVGTLTNGQVFDSSLDRGTPFTFILGSGQVIRGWDEGLVGLKEGGRRVLLIAPDYGYGANGAGPIPPNSSLIFRVELVKVEAPSDSTE